MKGHEALRACLKSSLRARVMGKFRNRLKPFRPFMGGCDPLRQHPGGGVPHFLGPPGCHDQGADSCDNPRNSKRNLQDGLAGSESTNQSKRSKA